MYLDNIFGAYSNYVLELRMVLFYSYSLTLRYICTYIHIMDEVDVRAEQSREQNPNEAHGGSSRLAHTDNQ